MTAKRENPVFAIHDNITLITNMQRTMKRHLLYPLLSAALVLMAGMTSVAHSQDFNGSWSGVLEFGPSSYTIVFNIQQTGDDVAITWDFPDQNAFNLPATATISGNELNVDMPASNASYKGILEGEALNGTFTQHGFDITLNMTRTGEVQDTRPQETAIETDTNKPYRSEDVTFNNGDIIFSGTLTLPDKGRHFPAVVLVAGSGPLDRDEEAFGHKPFLLLADALSRNGFAVLRYDERGVGATIGGDPGAPSEPLATDAMAALRYLKTRPEVDATRVGFVGHSEGGLIAVMNAAKHPDEVAYIVSLAGPGVPGKELGMTQTQLGFKAAALEFGEDLMKMNEDFYTIIDTERDSVTMCNKLTEYFHQQQGNPALQQYLKGVPTAQYIKLFALPMVRCVFQYDPTENLKRVKCPMLAINGMLDCQVACENNLDGIKRHVPHATVKAYEGLNHFFQTCSEWKGSANYSAIHETMSPVVLQDIVTWLQSTVKQ